MKAFTEPLESLQEFNRIKKDTHTTPGITQISGCIDAAKTQLIYSLTEPEESVLIVTFSEQRARELVEDCQFFYKKAVYYPARDVLFYQSDVRGNLLTRERLSVQKQLRLGQRVVVVTTFDGLMDRLIPLNATEHAVLTIQPGDTMDLEKMKKDLVSMGYEKNYQVEAPGQFASRGGILDVFPLSEEVPVRIELWGDEIDALRSFDPESQRAIENLEEVILYPASELILTKKNLEKGIQGIKKDAAKMEESFRKEFKNEEAHRVKARTAELLEALNQGVGSTEAESFLTYFYQDTVSFLDYLPEGTRIYLDEPARIAEKGRVVSKEFQESMQQRLEKGYCISGQADVLFSDKEIFARIERKGAVALTTLEMSTEHLTPARKYSVTTRTINPYNHSFELLVKDLLQYQKQEYQTVLVSGSRTRAKRLAMDLADEGVHCFYTEDYDHEIKKGELLVCYGKLKRGYEFPLIQYAVISETDVFGAETSRKKKRKTYEGDKIQSFTELHIGDYVVHENHGLGVYRGIEKVEVDKVTKDYIKIEYDKGGVLYIHVSSLNLLQKYAGADAKKPKLNKLGTQEWTKTKTRVRGAVREIAKDLVKLYAIRENTSGFSYGPDTVWQKEFEELFPFEETTDQEQAIEATKKDMESSKNMDRLICGDVGFGKTEIAIRAAFKAVQEGKQVAYLVPTTILAQQHYNTFAQRMKDFPVRVDLLCRFRTLAQQKNTLEDLGKGQVDIVIGTHRLLSKDVRFKDLGLLIIDEEQRFGVAHKEKIKQIKARIDVLTLTATPIPRTLHMSLVGIRDMSILEEAPIDRMPVQTYVLEYNEELVREAINRELARGGQVFYVFNRVKQIEDVAGNIARMVPDAEVAYAHGQMHERELERIMYSFINGEIDVLVSTTIIETGLDIANVNTMIIEDADNMGLSQLYQLRGRVGRSNRTAYAFLMYKRDKMLKEIAEKRLSAIKEFTELGSGFKIAMKDLEIRGAGNLLGEDQSGHMEAVGYDLYCKMLNEAVKELKGIVTPKDYETVLDLTVDAYIPETYVPNEYQKLDLYKRIAAIESQADQEEMTDELTDRFGDLPKPVLTLLRIARIRARAHEDYITEINQKGGELKIILYEKAGLLPAKIPEFLALFKGDMRFYADAQEPSFILKQNSRRAKQEILEQIEEILGEIEGLLLMTDEEKL